MKKGPGTGKQGRKGDNELTALKLHAVKSDRKIRTTIKSLEV